MLEEDEQIPREMRMERPSRPRVEAGGHRWDDVTCWSGAVEVIA